ncbi:MAG: hypothetical protein V1494_03510 [Candidatus Diapherotrites archaeon]
MQKKLRVGFFSFTCDEGCIVYLLEILNTHYHEWLPLLDIAYCRQLKKKNSPENLDVAFIEGAISTPSEEVKLKHIRKESRRLVALGQCAIMGHYSAQRNQFSPAQKKEIDFLVKKFHQLKKVLALKDLVKVDAEVFGCPIDEGKFVESMGKFLQEFGVVKANA